MLGRLLAWIRARRAPSLLGWITQLVETHPPVPIERVLEGEVLLQGVARTGPVLLQAPLSNISVIAFRVVVEAHGLQGTRRLVDFSRAVDFVVEDATGQATIRCRGAQPLLEHEYSGESEPGLLPPAVTALLNAFGSVDWSRRTPHRLSWAEHYLEPGEPVVVYGLARQEIDPTREPVGYRQSATRLVVVKPDRAPLFFADQPRDDLLRRLRG
jgi:hypothetical protein